VKTKRIIGQRIVVVETVTWPEAEVIAEPVSKPGKPAGGGPAMTDLDGKTIIFRGCSWDDHWEYDAPAVVYSPYKSYSPNGGGANTAADLVQSICSDLADGELERVKAGWGSDLKEFQWRGWSPAGFRRRRAATHVELHVRFLSHHAGRLRRPAGT